MPRIGILTQINSSGSKPSQLPLHYQKVNGKVFNKMCDTIRAVCSQISA